MQHVVGKGSVVIRLFPFVLGAGILLGVLTPAAHSVEAPAPTHQWTAGDNPQPQIPAPCTDPIKRIEIKRIIPSRPDRGTAEARAARTHLSPDGKTSVKFEVLAYDAQGRLVKLDPAQAQNRLEYPQPRPGDVLQPDYAKGADTLWSMDEPGRLVLSYLTQKDVTGEFKLEVCVANCDVCGKAEAMVSAPEHSLPGKSPSRWKRVTQTVKEHPILTLGIPVAAGVTLVALGGGGGGGGGGSGGTGGEGGSFAGSVTGSWSGSQLGQGVQGTFHATITASGIITGTFQGGDGHIEVSESFSGTVDGSGNISAGTGSFRFVGRAEKSGDHLKGRGTWSTNNGGGTWVAP